MSHGSDWKVSALGDLMKWKKEGYHKIVLFGRFQPLHKGHMQLLETLRASKLDVHLVLNDKTDDIPGERNPFNPEQKKQMVRLALPWLPEENLHTATVYLGRPGVDVGDDVRRLSSIFKTIGHPSKMVFSYFEKDEDRKSYLVDGKRIDGVHYVELVGKPHGEFPVMRITEEMICAATGTDHIPIDAKMFRSGIAQEDGICFELLDPAVATYVHEQYQLAAANSRLVGADPTGDRVSLLDLRKTNAGQPALRKIIPVTGFGVSGS